MKKVLVVFGTRPEAIKMAPLINKIKGVKDFETRVCVAAQHREMLDTVLELFGIVPDFDLNIMRKQQNITYITVEVLKKLGEILKKERPDLVLVQGDTTTTMAAALASFYEQIPVGHVEAGLRSGNIYSPYPEEMNRRITSNIASLHFAPTTGNRDNLLKSGISEGQIFVTGNTVIDALYLALKEKYHFSIPILNEIDYANKKVILMTVHRRENWGAPMRDIFQAVESILISNPDVKLLFPVHMNPKVKDLADEFFKDITNAHIIPPLDYEPFVNLMARSYLVLTDSGGIQEEAPALGKPVLVLRTETERPEAVEAGTVKVVGVKKDGIIKITQELLDNKVAYDSMAKAVNPYGDGRASEKIVKYIKKGLL